MLKICPWVPVALGALSFILIPTLKAASGTEGAAFLDIPVGAGPAALGSAYSALADNAYASVWNPGALAFVDSLQVAGQHLSYLESIYDEYLGLAVPLRRNQSALGFSAQYLGTGNITQTNVSGYNTGTFGADYGAYSLAYGQKLGDHLGFGATMKWVHAELSASSANAYAADVGLLYKLQDRWRLAATMTNLGSKLTFIDQSDGLPQTLHLAAAYQPNPRWTLTTETLHNWPSNRTDARFGLEVKPLDMLALRAGYRTDTLSNLSPLAGFTVGMGLDLWGQEFAYAWLPYGDLGDTQYFSLLIRFGEQDGKPTLRRADIIIYHGHESRPAGETSASQNEMDYEQLLELLTDQSDRRVMASLEGRGQ